MELLKVRILKNKFLKCSLIRGFFICLLLFSVLLGGCSCAVKKNEKKRFGIIEETVFDTYLDKYYPNNEKIYFDAISDLPEALISGKIDAYLADDPVARVVCKRYPELTITKSVRDTDFGFVLPLDHTKLQGQLNEYLQKLKDTGMLESKESMWLGDFENLYEIDMEGLTGKNGELKVAVLTDANERFVFLKDGIYMGYEIDILVSFCKEYGYSISFTNLPAKKFFDGIANGEYDIGAGCITISEERKSRMLFSDWDYRGNLVLVEKKKNDKNSNSTSILSLHDLSGHNIGLYKGTSSEDAYKNYLIEGNPVYYDSSIALAEALERDEIAAYILDEPIVRAQNHKYPTHRQLARLKSDTYAFAFPKNSNFSVSLHAMFNEFLKESQIDGTMDELNEIWFNNKIEKKAIDYKSLSGENGTINFAISTGNIPFSYKDEQGYYGFDIDLAVRFCQKYGFALNIADYKFADLLENISNENCDMGASCITITEERSEIVKFSDPVYYGGLVLVAKTPKLEKIDGRIYSIDDLSGQKIAVQAGTMLDQIVTKYIPNSYKDYYNSATDMAVAIETGKAMAYCADEPVARLMCQEYDTHRILSMVTTESYGFVFPKKNENSAKLQGQMNKFLTRIKEIGILAEIDAVWFGNNSEAQVVDFSDLTGENGKLTMSVCTAVGPPFIYVKDNKYVGYDVDIAYRFCKEYGYDLTIVDYNADGLFSSIGGGKCDLAASCIAITEERKETMRFSFPYYDGGCVVVIKDIYANKDEKVSFIENILNSFNRTFIREKRWKLFVKGFGVSSIIVIFSAICGTIFGFLFYYIYWHGNKIYCKILDAFIFVLGKLPVVVVLMIIYYIIFSEVDMGGVGVSIIGFSVLFAGNIVGLLKVAVGAVNITQKEAAIALGYSEDQALFKFIMPQALVHFLPGYKGTLVSLIKETATVGYIAVQDLTKVSDIVRSRTYEAFFPLVATALIYFIIACIIIGFIRQIEIGIRLDKRKISLLKGVKTR